MKIQNLYFAENYLKDRLENLGDSFPAEQRALTDLLILVQEEKRRQVRLKKKQTWRKTDLVLLE